MDTIAFPKSWYPLPQNIAIWVEFKQNFDQVFKVEIDWFCPWLWFIKWIHHQLKEFGGESCLEEFEGRYPELPGGIITHGWLCYTKYSSWTWLISITWEFVRNADLQAPSHLLIATCTLMNSASEIWEALGKHGLWNVSPQFVFWPYLPPSIVLRR